MMRATVTSKGQVTLPKPIRDALKIEPGARLDFQLTPEGKIEVRKVESDPLSIVGLVKRGRRKPVTVEEMRKAVANAAVERYRRTKK